MSDSLSLWKCGIFMACHTVRRQSPAVSGPLTVYGSPVGSGVARHGHTRAHARVILVCARVTWSPELHPF